MACIGALDFDLDFMGIALVGVRGRILIHQASEWWKNRFHLLRSIFTCDIMEYDKCNVELAIKNQAAIIIFQVHHHDFRGKQILITFSKALIKFAIDMLYYHFF